MQLIGRWQRVFVVCHYENKVHLNSSSPCLSLMSRRQGILHFDYRFSFDELCEQLRRLSVCRSINWNLSWDNFRLAVPRPTKNRHEKKAKQVSRRRERKKMQSAEDERRLETLEKSHQRRRRVNTTYEMNATIHWTRITLYFDRETVPTFCFLVRLTAMPIGWKRRWRRRLFDVVLL